ncbi:hypothetical protein ACF0H5_009589 [Mactra antiquata]
MLDTGKMAVVLRTKQFKILAVLAVFCIIAIIFIMKKDAKDATRGIVHRRMVDHSSMNLNRSMSEDLEKKHGLKALKSRDATIFVDDLGRVRIPPDDIIELMKYRDLEELYHRYLESIQIPCTRQVHLGSFEDGGYDLCEHPKVIPSKPCMVYSFGVRDDFSFDEQLSSNYGCEIHSFDPANGMKDHQHSTNVYFHSMGLSNKDEIINGNWKMRTLKTIKKELGHTDSNISIMKIDIEGGEWTALPEILDSGTLLGVKQLIMEFHSWVDLHPFTVDGRNVKDYSQHLKVLKRIYDEGFRIFFFKRFPAKCCIFTDEFNMDRVGCHEVHLMRISG